MWGLSWVLWALSGAGPSVPVTGILGGVLVGMLAGLGVAAALGGRRLAGRRRAQRLWGGGVGLLAGFLGLWGAVLVLASWGQVAQFTWPAWVLAVAAGALVTPWVIDGRAGRSSPLR